MMVVINSIRTFIVITDVQREEEWLNRRKRENRDYDDRFNWYKSVVCFFFASGQILAQLMCFDSKMVV